MLGCLIVYVGSRKSYIQIAKLPTFYCSILDILFTMLYIDANMFTAMSISYLTLDDGGSSQILDF